MGRPFVKPASHIPLLLWASCWIVTFFCLILPRRHPRPSVSAAFIHPASSSMCRFPAICPSPTSHPLSPQRLWSHICGYLSKSGGQLDLVSAAKGLDGRSELVNGGTGAFWPNCLPVGWMLARGRTRGWASLCVGTHTLVSISIMGSLRLGRA